MEPVEEAGTEKKTPAKPAELVPEARTSEPEALATQEPPSTTTSDRMVRPSEVARDRVRTSELKIKSELEKAREAFARAEEVGIEEGTEGIVETRMLRASEVRELMDSAAEMSRTAEATPPPTMADTPDAVPAPSPTTMPTPDDIEKGILGSKSTIGGQMRTESEKPSIPEPPPVLETAPPVTETPSPPVPSEVERPASPPAQKVTAPKVAAVASKEPIPSPAAQKLVPEVDVLEMKIHDPDYLDDVSISGRLTDLRNLYKELKQVKSDLEEITARLDTEVLNYRNAEQVKKLRYEGLETETKLAKEEWNDARKEHKIAGQRRKKEISGREQRIGKIEKRIRKAESDIEKRVKELDKDKEKLAI